MRPSSKIERLLPSAFVATVVTGIGLHIAGHGSSHEVWHTWVVAHGVSGFLWLVSGVFHIKRHWHWYKTIASKGIGKKSRITLALSADSLIIVFTGILLTACMGEPNSTIGLLHYWLGLLLIVLTIIHIAKRK